MTVQDALKKAGCILKEKNTEAPVKEAGVLLAFVLSKDLSWLYAHPEALLSPDQEVLFEDCLYQRSKGVPFQYISKTQEFMSLDFHVDPDCLIPRSDTEILVEYALDWMKKKTGIMRVLDIGTGSGAIAVSVAYYYENCFVDAMDLSDAALSIARTNAERYQVHDRIRFFREDFLQWEPEKPYLVVLSNPPYIPHDDIKTLMPGVRDYEPRMALDGGSDGLLFYHAMASKISHLLLPGGVIFTEVGQGQAETVGELFRAQGLKVQKYKDLAGIVRVVSGERKCIPL